MAAIAFRTPPDRVSRVAQLYLIHDTVWDLSGYEVTSECRLVE